MSSLRTTTGAALQRLKKTFTRTRTDETPEPIVASGDAVDPIQPSPATQDAGVLDASDAAEPETIAFEALQAVSDAAPEPDLPVESTTPVGPPPRRGLIPRWLVWTGLGVGAALVFLLLAVAFWPAGQAVQTPKFVGDTATNVAKRANKLGLHIQVADTYFSTTVPRGVVISQDPTAGVIIPQGTTVRVVVSSGSEIFPMPNVVGQRLDAARRTLRELGLDVTFITVQSTSAQGTVILSAPSAGTSITVGDTVRLSIAAGVGATGTILPTDLTGSTFVLDPAPAPSQAGSDVTYDIARRVRALLEASNARVVMTRSLSENVATVTEATRVDRATETSTTALVQVMVAPSGSVGLQVVGPPAVGLSDAAQRSSATLAAAMLNALRADFPSTTTTTSATAILNGYTQASVRLRLGSASSSTDRANFGDGQWADTVARDIYSSLSRTYGHN